MQPAATLGVFIVFVALPVSAYSQQSASWRDASPHTVRFVTVEKNVRLEVLDWGGAGRSVVLLAGGGNTAHVFDELAPKLATDYHVYGVSPGAGLVPPGSLPPTTRLIAFVTMWSPFSER